MNDHWIFSDLKSSGTAFMERKTAKRFDAAKARVKAPSISFAGGKGGIT